MKVLSQLSGGLDSVASTILVAEEGNEFATIFFNYGQPYYKQELKAVKYVDKYLKNRYPDTYKGLHISKVDIATASVDGMPTEYIPVRNFVFGAASVNKALTLGYHRIAVGSKTTVVRQDDPYSFSDCSVEFYKRMGHLANYCSDGRGIDIQFIMPLVQLDYGVWTTRLCALTKKEVIEVLINNACDVKQLWSCYTPGDKHCGKCYHCEEIKKTGYWNYFS